jgi:hypothetical protein
MDNTDQARQTKAGSLSVLSASRCSHRECQTPPTLPGSFAANTARTRPGFGRSDVAERADIYATQLCSTTSFTRFAYSLRFSCHSRAASALAGELGFGSFSSDWIEVRIAAMS